MKNENRYIMLHNLLFQRAIRCLLFMAFPYIICLAQVSQTYYLIDLGSLGGSEGTNGYGINNKGQVVGSSFTAAGEQHPFLYTGGAMVDLRTFGGNGSAALGINNRGQVVGYSTTSYSNNDVERAFLYESGSLIDLGTPIYGDSVAYGINDAGQIVGQGLAAEQAEQAFVDVLGSIKPQPLGSLCPQGNNESRAIGINDSGQIVGSTDICGLLVHAMLYSGGRMLDLGTLAGDSDSFAVGINNAGQIVGVSATFLSESHAFLYNGGVMTGLGALGGRQGQANGINNNGTIVGWAQTSTGEDHAFVYTGGSMVDLNTFGSLPAGAYLDGATAINDVGQIVAPSSGVWALTILAAVQRAAVQTI